ncbi:MAG: hypothetical protein SNG49_01590 [Rikenellaceae bacterium]
MKRALFTSLLLVAMINVGCEKEDLDFDYTPETAPEVTLEKISLFATSANNDTRVGFEDNTLSNNKISLSWENDGDDVDSFTLYDSTGARVGDFKYTGTDGATSGEFTQEGTFSMKDDETYTAVIPAGTYATLAAHNAASTTTSQTISTIGDINYLDGAIKLSGSFTYDEDGDNEIAFEHELCFARVVLTMPEGIIPSTVKMTDNGKSYSATLPSSQITDATNIIYIVCDPVASSESRSISFVITDTAGDEYTVTRSGATTPFVAGNYYTIGVTAKAIDYYEDGVEINGVTYSKSNATSIMTTSGTISNSGVIFLDPVDEDQVFTLNGAAYTNLVLIGRYKNCKPKVVCGGVQYFGAGDKIYKNLDLTGNSSGNTFTFISSTDAEFTITNWIVEDCDITTALDKPLSYFNNGSGSIENIKFDSNKIALTISETAKTGVSILSFNNVNVSNFKTVNLTNNTIYTSTDNYYANGSILSIVPSSTTTLNLTVTNNTIVDFISTNATFYLPDAGSISFDKNILWGNSSIASNTNLFFFTYASVSPSITFGENIAFGLSDSNYWRKYSSSESSTYPTDADEKKSVFAKSASDPFATFDKATGTFIPTAENSTYGAQ